MYREFVTLLYLPNLINRNNTHDNDRHDSLYGPEHLLVAVYTSNKACNERATITDKNSPCMRFPDTTLVHCNHLYHSIRTVYHYQYTSTVYHFFWQRLYVHEQNI